MEGGSYYDYYIKEWAGVDPEDGSAMWYKDIVDKDNNVAGRETTKLYSEATDYKVVVPYRIFTVVSVLRSCIRI